MAHDRFGPTDEQSDRICDVSENDRNASSAKRKAKQLKNLMEEGDLAHTSSPRNIGSTTRKAQSDRSILPTPRSSDPLNGFFWGVLSCRSAKVKVPLEMMFLRAIPLAMSNRVTIQGGAS